MSSRLNPYIHLDGTAREALEFYQRIFGGDVALNTYGELGSPDAPFADKIMHGMLEGDDGFALMISDVPPGMEYEPGGNITISISGDDASTLRRYWEELSAGASVSVPLEKQMWGDEFGQCRDKFGVAWMVNIEAA
ncbi:VOC family protein [Georgenia wangjunii]|uniref:VOC family protein n=1 Tax=Georgenia wangjunii TaxID=3117730 RepID=UPI002F264A41